ncbi:MAG: hypothetical protein ACOWWO_03460 [Peptococcaceae bacterium]
MENKELEKKELEQIIPSDAKINTSSPGVLAIERFKAALALNTDEREKAQELRETLLEE